MVLYLVVFWNFTLIKFILVLSNNGGFSIQLLKDLSFASSLISSKSVRHKLAEENLKFYFVFYVLLSDRPLFTWAVLLLQQICEVGKISL